MRFPVQFLHSGLEVNPGTVATSIGKLEALAAVKIVHNANPRNIFHSNCDRY